MGNSSVKIDFDVLFINLRLVAKTLSVPRILKVCLILFIGGFLIGFYEQRIDILHALMRPLLIRTTNPAPKPLHLSEKHFRELELLLNRSPGVNSVAVVSVDFRANAKQVVYTNSNKLLNKIFILPDAPLQLFTDNLEMNKRTVSLMSGGVMCMDSSKTDIGTFVPDLEKSIPFSCAVSIPPTYGEFAGWIFVGFDRKLTDWELQQVKIDIIKISAMIKRGA